MPNPFANEELSALLDGELSDVEAAEVEALLDADPALRAELQELEQASQFLRTHGPVQAPSGFEQRVLALVASEPQQANGNTWWRRPFGVPVEGLAVAAVALLVLGVSLTPGLLQVGAGQKGMADHAVARLEHTDKKASGAAALPARSEAPAPEAEPPAVDSSVAAAPVGGAPASAGEWAPEAVEQERPSKKGAEPSRRSADAPTKTASSKPAAAKAARDKLDEAYEPPAEQVALATPVQQQASTAAPAPPPKMTPVVYRYILTTDDPDALAALQRLASRYKGNVERSGTRGGVDGSYKVKIPSSALTEFGDALRSLGQVQEQPDDRWYGDTNPTVQVDIRYVPAARQGVQSDKASSSEAP